MTALQNASNKLDEPLFFGYTLQLLLGEDFAKEDLTSLIDILRRIPDLKRDIQPFVIKGKAEQAFKTKLPSEPNLAFFLRELFKNPKFYDDKLHFNSLGELYRDLSTSSSKTGVLPYLAAGKEELQLLGSALIQANKLVDTLTIEETSILNNLRDCKPGALTYLQLPNKSEISFLPYKIKTNLKVKDQVITYRVQLEGGLSENTSQIIASTSAGNKKLEKLLTSYYNDRAEKLIKKLQTEQLDPLLLGRYLAAHYPDYWVQENWPAQFQMLPIKVKYKIHLSSAGLVTK
jgi:spore germination protein